MSIFHCREKLKINDLMQEGMRVSQSEGVPAVARIRVPGSDLLPKPTKPSISSGVGE